MSVNAKRNACRRALALGAVVLTLGAVPTQAAAPLPKKTATAHPKVTGLKKPLAGKPLPGKKPLGKKLRGKPVPGTESPDEEPLATDSPVLVPTAPPANLAPPEPAPPPAAATASPAPSSGPEPERPWAKGVSKQDQERALELFRAGNVLLKENIFIQAAEKYRQALALWSHPAIHYNLALVLMNLDQPIEVHEHLEAALRYGAQPLEAEKFEYAKHYRSLIEKQLARVEIGCDKPGTTVLLDGRSVLVAPGHYSALLRPGAHTIVASLAGYLNNDQSRTLQAGETTNLDLKMYTSEDLTRYRRKMPAAVPWLVMGAGAALAGGGALLHMRARDDFQAFDTGITECGGCVPQGELATQRSRGTLMQNMALGGYAVGGAALVTGAVLAFINAPQAYRIEPGQLSQEHVRLTPLLGAGSGGIQATLRFF